MERIAEWERYWRILRWNRLDDEDYSDSEALPQRCRTAWCQLAAVAPAASLLPSEFLYPLRAYRYRSDAAVRLYHDDEQIVLYISDLRDYLFLTRDNCGANWDAD